MRYNLFINQKAIIDSKLDIDIYDAHILSFISQWIKSNEVKKMLQGNTNYYWISYKLIMANLPLLNIKKDTVYRRLKKMSEMGIIIPHQDNQIMGATYYAMTEIFSILTYGLSSEPTDTNPNPYGYKSEPPTDENPNPLRIEIRTPTDVHPNNNIYNNNNKNYNIINDNINKDDFDKSVVVKEEKKVKKEKIVFQYFYPQRFSPYLIETLNQYFKYRSDIKKPYKSQQAIDQRIKTLDSWLNQFTEEEIIQSINNSIANQWQGIFEPKKSNQNGTAKPKLTTSEFVAKLKREIKGH